MLYQKQKQPAQALIVNLRSIGSTTQGPVELSAQRLLRAARIGQLSKFNSKASKL